MRVLSLPEMSSLEKRLVRRLSGSARKDATWRTFPDGEIAVSVRSTKGHAVVLGKTGPSGDDLLRTLLLLDTAKRTGAACVTLVVPYLSFGRQDRAVERGDSVAAGLVMRLIAKSGATRIVTADLHSGRARRMATVPIEDVSPTPLFAKALRRSVSEGMTVVAPDDGSRKKAQELSDLLGLGDIVWLEKHRARSGKTSIRGMRGRLKGDSAVLIDDILSTGGTIRDAAAYLRRRGVRTLRLCITHPVFCGDAVDAVRALRLDRLFVTDTIPLSLRASRLKNIHILSMADLLAEAVLFD